jgi:hypothetical protein
MLELNMFEKVKDLFRQGSLALNFSGFFNAGLFLICLALSFADDRSVTGVNPWLKPMKFCLSVMIYCFTLSIILGLIDGFEKMRVWIGRLVTVVMLVEQTAITLQAARGVTSHYNTATSFDGLIFAAMGIGIGVNTVLASLVFGLMVLVPLATVPTGVLWGIRFGLMMFIAAGFEGGTMILNQAHTVGGPDGGPGIPVANWSTKFGDYRVAHFIGLHALQILPAVGLLVDRFTPSNLVRGLTVVVVSAALGWLMWVQTQLAAAGKPFWNF